MKRTKDWFQELIQLPNVKESYERYQQEIKQYEKQDKAHNRKR